MLLTHGQLSEGKSGRFRRSPYIHRRALVLYVQAVNQYCLPDLYPVLATAASLFHLFARVLTETAINVYLGT